MVAMLQTSSTVIQAITHTHMYGTQENATHINQETLRCYSHSCLKLRNLISQNIFTGRNKNIFGSHVVNCDKVLEHKVCSEAL